MTTTSSATSAPNKIASNVLEAARRIEENSRTRLRFRRAQVLRVSVLTPRMRRITLGGPDLAGFGATGSGSERIKLGFPQPGAPVVLPEWTPNGWKYPAGAPELAIRAYTVRAWRPDVTELDVDMVLHEHGPGGRFAATARPGDEVGVAGPGPDYARADDAPWHLIAGDETALPAISTILATLPAGARAYVFVEVADAAEEQPLASPADLTVTWLHRDGDEPGTGGRLPAAIRAFTWPEGSPHTWVAGETAAVRDIRRYLRFERGLPKESVQVYGYWRRGLDGHRLAEEAAAKMRSALARGIDPNDLEDLHV